MTQFDFDAIINATENAMSSNGNARTSNHDINKIQVDASKDGGGSSIEAQIAAIRSGRWDAAEYGISAEAQIARLQAANTPETKAKALAEMRQRAINRAGLDVSNGRVSVMVAGENARKAHWHVLGVSIQHVVDSAEAMYEANLNWPVDKIQMEYHHNGEYRNADKVFALVRRDTGAFLGTVGNIYNVVQNADGFSVLDKVLEDFGARYETAGALFGGKKVWCQAQLPKFAFTLPGNDENVPLITFFNVHGGEAGHIYPTYHRVVCANTQRISSEDYKHGLRFRHTGSVHNRIAAIKDCIGLSTKAMESYKSDAETLYRKNINIMTYAHDVLDTILDVADAQRKVAKAQDTLDNVLAIEDAEKKLEAILKRKTSILEQVLAVHDSQTVAASRGTAWGAFNSFSEVADFGKKVGPNHGADLSSRRLESVLDGDADELKQLAFNRALALAV